MAITHNYLETAGYKPTAGEASKAELIPNLSDGTLWTENGSGTVIQLGGGSYTGGTAITISGTAINHDSHTGDVTGTGALTIGDAKVTLAKMANLATDTFIGRTTAGTGVPEELSVAAALTMLNVEAGAEANNISDVNAADLTDGGDTTLHGHAAGDITGLGTAALVDTGTTNGTVPLLDSSGYIPTSTLPPLSITSTYTAATEVAQLALTVQEGDVCVRTDESKSYVALNGDNADMGDWQELLSPTSGGTNISTGSITSTVVPLTSSTGTGVDLTSASTTVAGLLTAAKWDEIVANTSKDTNVGSTIATGTRTATTYPVDLDGGGAYTFVLADTSHAGMMSDAQFDKLGWISVTQAVDLDTMESNQVGSLLTGEAV